MSLDDPILTCFCLIDNALSVITGDKRLRRLDRNGKWVAVKESLSKWWVVH